MSGNNDGYDCIKVLQKDNILVLTDLLGLLSASRNALDEIFNLSDRGIHITVLADGFNSAGEYGDHVLSMIKSAYILGQVGSAG